MAARSGMADVITFVRELAACGTADYAVGGVTYWTDEQVQTHLDRVRVELWDELTYAVPSVNSGGTTIYTDYRIPYQWLESTTGGTAIFYLTEADGTRIGTTNYTIDYATGRVTFGVDQAGSVRYVTGRSYDVYEAAARIWESKAAHVADRYDFSADGASFKASQLATQYMAAASRLRMQSNSGGLQTSRMVRDDIMDDSGVWGVKVVRIP